MCDGVFGDEPEQNRRDGDAELRGGELTVEVLQRLQHRLSLPVAPTRQRFDPGAPRRYQGEFRRHEKRIRRDQYDHGEHTKREGPGFRFSHETREKLAGDHSTSSATF